MDHIKALALKFIIHFAVLAVILGVFYGVSLMSIFTVSVLLTGVSYVIGDLYILPRFENWGASLADYGLAFLGVWFLGYYLFDYTTPLITASAIAALFIAGAEYFFHQYIATRIFEAKSEGAHLGIHYQTEFSEEFDSDVKESKRTDHNIKL